MTPKEHLQLTLKLKSAKACYNTANHKAAAAFGEKKAARLSIADIKRKEIESLEEKLR